MRAINLWPVVAEKMDESGDDNGSDEGAGVVAESTNFKMPLALGRRA